MPRCVASVSDEALPLKQQKSHLSCHQGLMTSNRKASVERQLLLGLSVREAFQTVLEVRVLIAKTNSRRNGAGKTAEMRRLVLQPGGG